MHRLRSIILLKQRFLLLMIVFILPLAAFAETTERQNVDQSGMFEQIRHFATFSNIVYKDPVAVKSAVDSLGYELTSFSQIADYKISYLLATNHKSKTQIIAVRGTANVENAVIDASVKLIHDNNLGIYLHEGFATAANDIYGSLLPQLNKAYTISTTGHSLGGAVALILAMHLDNDHFNVARVVTFGQPKVTNIPGALKYADINILRVVTPKDIVPLVPPFDPVDINNLDIYWHAGTEVILLKDKEYSIVSGVKSMMRATKFLNAQPDEENIRHHQMSLYLSLLDSKQSGATLVPYEIDFSFINRFFGN